MMWLIKKVVWRKWKFLSLVLRAHNTYLIVEANEQQRKVNEAEQQSVLLERCATEVEELQHKHAKILEAQQEAMKLEEEISKFRP